MIYLLFFFIFFSPRNVLAEWVRGTPNTKEQDIQAILIMLLILGYFIRKNGIKDVILAIGVFLLCLGVAYFASHY